MLVQDIYGGAHQTLGLSGNLIASSFGKSATADKGTCQDLPFMLTKTWPTSVPRASLCPLVWRDKSHRFPLRLSLLGLSGAPLPHPALASLECCQITSSASLSRELQARKSS